MQRRWDIFCRVVDNYGDAGVTWRLAVELAQRGDVVCLYIDHPQTLHPLADSTSVEGVSVKPWPSESTRFSAADVADVVIEAFACDPPAAYIAAMAERALSGNGPCWINLEYLSAENWVETHHKLPSPHPRYPLTKYFYFPGFTPASGGLIREAWISHALPTPYEQTKTAEIRIFLFCYAQPQLTEWLRALDRSSDITRLSAAPCPAVVQIQAHVNEHIAPMSMLTIDYHPFVPQRDFDRVLAEHDLLFVRGEDSFVRAQLAGKPLIWHIYPQENQAHLAKLTAFYTLYLNASSLSPRQQALFLEFVMAWNGINHGSSCADLWPEIRQMLPDLQKSAQAWQEKLLAQSDLVSQLQAFIDDLVK